MWLRPLSLLILAPPFMLHNRPSICVFFVSPNPNKWIARFLLDPGSFCYLAYPLVNAAICLIFTGNKNRELQFGMVCVVCWFAYRTGLQVHLLHVAAKHIAYIARNTSIITRSIDLILQTFVSSNRVYVLPCELFFVLGFNFEKKL